MNIIKLFCIAVMSMLTLIGCDKNDLSAGIPPPAYTSPEIVATSADAAVGKMMATASSDAVAAEATAPIMPEPNPNSSVAAGVNQRVIIKNADITLVVSDASKQLAPITAIAKSYGGFVLNSNFNHPQQGVTSGNISIKVDASRLEEALAKLKALAIEVRNESINSEDVTGEFIDISARLKNLESAEAQLHEIMKKATKTADVMSVFSQLTQMRSEIDQVKGRIKFLSESAALSTVNIALEPDAVTKPIEVAGWHPTGVALRAVESLMHMLQSIGNALIWALIFALPLLLLFLGLRWLLRRFR